MIIRQLDIEKCRGKRYKTSYETNKYYDVVCTEDGFSLVLKKCFQMEKHIMEDELCASWLDEPIAFGAFEDDVFIGYIEGSMEKWHNAFRLSNIFVEEKYRRNGVAKKLIQYFIQYVENNSTARCILLEAQTCNYGAISLYKQCGFFLSAIDTFEYTNHDVESHECRINMCYPLHQGRNV